MSFLPTFFHFTSFVCLVRRVVCVLCLFLFNRTLSLSILLNILWCWTVFGARIPNSTQFISEYRIPIRQRTMFLYSTVTQLRFHSSTTEFSSSYATHMHMWKRMKKNSARIYFRIWQWNTKKSHFKREDKTFGAYKMIDLWYYRVLEDKWQEYINKVISISWKCILLLEEKNRTNSFWRICLCSVANVSFRIRFVTETRRK